jgi:serine/threonine-protein kinase
MSRVFVAREIALDRDVVVKVLPPELAGELSVERFRREIQFAARLQHPHIVPVLAAGSATVKGDGLSDRTVLYYTMPFIDGETLRAKLQRTGELPIADVVRISRALADSLGYAHERGVVHRDLKPENILLTRGHALVADFGVAKAVDASVLKTARDSSVITSVGLALGTPAYMAPEQAAADPAIDHRADIYALGCVVYELLTGSSPFAGRPAQAILAAHMAEAPDAVSRRRPATPPGLAALVMRMLEKRPADRPQTADEVLAALESLGTISTPAADVSYAGGVATAVAATNASATLPQPARSRTMWRIGIVGGLVAGLAIVGVMVTNFAGKRQPSPDPSEPPAVAIVDQTAASDPKLKAVSASIGEFLTDALSGGDGARLISEAAAARFLISTTASPVGSDSALLRVRLIDQRSGQVLRAFTPARVSLTDPGSGTEGLRGRVRAAVGLVTHPMLGPAALPASDAPTSEAFAEFRAALVIVERLLSGITVDQSNALAHMERAAALDSSFVQPRIWRAFLMRSGLTGRPIADSILLRLNAESSEMFTPYERALVALFRSSFTGDVGSAVRSSEMLYTATPVEWTAQAHARSLIAIARYKSAIALLDSLAPTAGADDPQFWSDYTRALHVTGDHEKELKVARRAVSLMPERRGVRSFVASALFALDSGEAAIRVINDAVTMPVELDATTGSVVSGLSTAISELRAHGNLKLVPGLEARLRDEIADATTAGNPPFALQLQIASALLNLGDDSAARSIAIELRRTDTLRFEIAAIIGVASARLGDTATAEREMQRLSDIGNRFRPYSLGLDLLGRARIAAALGRESQAVSLAAKSIAAGNGHNVRRAAHTVREFQALKRNRDFQKLLGARGE